MLARYFARLDGTLFVHVDARADAGAYAPLVRRHANVRLVRQRVAVYWGGFSMLLATVAGLREARSAGRHDRYMLLSENTVPLRTPARLAGELAADVEFLHSHPVPETPDDLVRRRYEGWYCFDGAAVTAAERFTPLFREVDDAVLERMRRMGELRQRGKVKLPGLRHGSQWWALSEAAVARVLDTHTMNAWLRESFEFSAFPDEQYVQSILALADWRRPCRMFMHTDFSRDPRPFIYRSAEELTALREGPCCMVRKVDVTAPGVAEYMREITAG